jgi:GGDEF domain-containing protein
MPERKRAMSGKIRFIAVGAVFLVLSLFLYFTIRFKYIERDLIDSLIRTTNRIVAEYHDVDKRAADEKKTLTNEDLAAFLRSIHGKNRDIALLAITDSRLSLRLSSKNDRFIRTTALFEAILKDFTQDRFNISKSSPFITRYYDERIDGATDQLKFYIFLNRIGERRLLVVYPYAFGDTILVRTVLEVCLVVVLVVIFTAVFAIVSGRRHAVGPEADEDGHTIDLGPGEGRAAREDGAVSRESSNVVSDTISGYIHDLFSTIHETYGTDSVALYLYHATGKLVKTMELKGSVFLRINSISFDTIDTDNEAGAELKSGTTMVLDGGARVVVPLQYNNAFLGTVSIVRRQGLRGSDVSEIKSGMAGILKNIHDFIMFNDVMTDAATGLHSKIYFSLKYNEYIQQWKHRGKNFSIMLIQLFGQDGQMGENEKNNAIRLTAPTIAGIVKKDGFLCRYDDYCAVILHDLNSRKTASLAGEIKTSLAKYRLKISADSVISIRPVIGTSSTDTPGAADDMIAFALKSIRQA